MNTPLFMAGGGLPDDEGLNKGLKIVLIVLGISLAVLTSVELYYRIKIAREKLNGNLTDKD